MTAPMSMEKGHRQPQRQERQQQQRRQPLIISASRRTDIPAFFSPWFMRRLTAGFAVSVNPFNPRQARQVSLSPRDVEAIVFWSKNPRPLLRHLGELDDRGFRYYFQFTLNAYDKALEPFLPPVAERVGTFLELAARLGRERVLWRYDPIILSSETPPAWHLDRLGAIGEELRGAAGRLTISFMDFYPKVQKRLSKVEESTGQRFYDAAEGERKDEVGELCRGIATLGRAWDLPVVSCGEPLDLAPYGIRAGACIDAELIRWMREGSGLFDSADVGGAGAGHGPSVERVAGPSGGTSAGRAAVGTARRDPNQRPECLCTSSVDLGAYNTCSHGCVYCYANFSPASIRANLCRHSPNTPSLLGEVAETSPHETAPPEE